MVVPRLCRCASLGGADNNTEPSGANGNDDGVGAEENILDINADDVDKTRSMPKQLPFMSSCTTYQFTPRRAVKLFIMVNNFVTRGELVAEFAVCACADYGRKEKLKVAR